MQRTFRAVPVSGPTSAHDEVSVAAATDFAALLQAQTMLGVGVSFDLYEGDRLVATYRPAASLGPGPQEDG